jgi:hypothetical protein
MVRFLPILLAVNLRAEKRRRGTWRQHFSAFPPSPVFSAVLVSESADLPSKCCTKEAPPCKDGNNSSGGSGGRIVEVGVENPGRRRQGEKEEVER